MLASLWFLGKGFRGPQQHQTLQDTLSVSTCDNTSSRQTTISSQQLRVHDGCHTRLLLEAEVPFVEKASLCL